MRVLPSSSVHPKCKVFSIVTNTLLMLDRTFGESAEVIRRQSKILSRWLYRIFYEDSATLCAYVSTHTQPKYREIPGLNLQLKLVEGNAFQSLAKPMVKDFTKQRIERHLNWQQKHPPSSYISTFNHISKYLRVNQSIQSI
jgi:hypothetical protein